MADALAFIVVGGLVLLVAGIVFVPIIIGALFAVETVADIVEKNKHN